MKKLYALFISVICFFTVKADHITGGEMYYSFAGVSGGTYNYNVTMKLFMRCNSGRQFSNPAIISVFSKSSGSRISDISVALGRQESLQLSNFSKCISDPPTVCYEVGYYDFSVSVPASADGYIIAGQVNYRVANIHNLTSGYGSIGATYTAEIPGTSALAAAPQNSSATFTGSDLVVICAGNSFAYSFAATDGDQLRYSFCNAYQSGTSGGGPNNSTPPVSPPYQPVPYSSDYNGSSPLGSSVNINGTTGLITGRAPEDAGIYVVTVCVEEIRNGKVIATQRKDIQVNVAPCTIASASLLKEYMLCRDTKTLTISNLSLSPLINSQLWTFINALGTTLFTATGLTITYTFPDTGTYRVTLLINKGQECSDSTTSLVRVYPGFAPDFTPGGICFTKLTRFTDASSTVYGRLSSWNWDFGENTGPDDISTQKNPTYTYPSIGQKNVRLIAGNSVGCLDTVYKNILITDKPPIALAFRDTLICVSDAVQLKATGNGVFNWTPVKNIRNAATANPIVTPPVTTTYFVDLDDDGCLNHDSVKVRVTDHVTLQVMNDTTICQNDTIRLHINSDGFQHAWTPALQLINPAVQNPLAVTGGTTTYEVTASIGSCKAAEQVIVTTVPYPVANAGADTIICYNTTAQLHASMNGNSFTWFPASTLNDRRSLSPVAKPATTTAYLFLAYNTKGCPKPGSDTVVVKVLPDIKAFAGKDTVAVTGQPLQLQATGGVQYVWSPATALSAANIANPVALFTQPSEGMQYKVSVYNEVGCVDEAFVKVKVFKTGPAVFVPNAFTPNKDGHNDVLRPIAAGILKIDYFNIYNRWGQLIYTTTENTHGWDGTLSGNIQESGTYVWMVKATDYTGKPYFSKGTVTLVR